jgi:hypothetical protein
MLQDIDTVGLMTFFNIYFIKKWYFPEDLFLYILY